MVVAFTMAALTLAHGGPLQKDGTSEGVGGWAFIIVWWLMVAVVLAFLGLGIVRRRQALTAGRGASPVEHP